MSERTGHELRILSYLDQKGPTHRANVVADLASPDSHHGRGISNGSNGAVPLVMGSWCKRLIAHRLVQCRYDRDGFYVHHEITALGKAALRAPRGEG